MNSRRRDGAVLLGGGEIAVKRHDEQTKSFTRASGTADLGRAGKEDQHVAIEPLLDQTFERVRDLHFERRGRVWGVLDAQIVKLSLGAQDLTAAKIIRDGLGIERGGHYDDVGIETLHQSQGKIGIEVTL